MNKKITITIGIPAFNEEGNIGNLLSDIGNQIYRKINLDKVIVVSDGSIDNTVKLAKSSTRLPLQIINNSDRKGVGRCQNQIAQNSTSDILIILNADIRITDKRFMEKLTTPIIKGSADLVSAKLKEVSTINNFEKVLLVSMMIKRMAFEKYKNGNNLYTCSGVARAFSRRFYTSLRYKTSIGEDAYSYLSCIVNKYIYIHVRNAIVYYKLPDNIADHQRQSLRFLKSKEENIKLFGNELVEQEYHIPINILLYALLKVIILHPKHTFAYLLICIYLKAKSLFSYGIKNTWEISYSSKSYSL